MAPRVGGVGDRRGMSKELKQVAASVGVSLSYSRKLNIFTVTRNGIRRRLSGDLSDAQLRNILRGF